MPGRSSAIAHLPTIRFCGRFSAREPVPFHLHEGSEIVYVSEGACRIRVGDEGALVGTTGTVLVLPAGVAHDQTNDGFCRTTYIDFAAPRLGFADRARAVALGADDPAVRWLEDACTLWAARPPAETALSALLLAVLERVRAVEARAAGTAVLPRAVAEATRWIERRLIEPIAVEAVARAVDLSPSHLTALFRTHLGCPPLRYQQRLRLALARRLLGNAYLSVSDVAAACGYDDAGYFIRRFRADSGVTPSRWRRGERPVPLRPVAP